MIDLRLFVVLTCLSQLTSKTIVSQKVMQTGFAMLEAGTIRASRTRNIIFKVYLCCTFYLSVRCKKI
jgi:ammonia channel protein AmtB